MKVLVIGGAGYIGSHVVRRLLDGGHQVQVFDNLSSGTRDNLFPEADFIQGDILDYPALLAAATEGQEAMVHLAAFKAAGESMEKPEKYAVNNIAGTINIINAAAERGIRRLVFSSSAAVYGEPVRIPIDEEHPKNPENFYGFTKLEIERLLDWYDRLKGIRSASLRYFNAAGYDMAGRIRAKEQNPANLLPIIMEVAAGTRPRLVINGNDYPTPDGTCVRDYIHVDDLAEGHLRALEYLEREDRSLTVNLGSEEGISVAEMLDAARRVTGEAIPAEIGPRRAGDPASLVASSRKARELLDWEARVSDVESLIASTWTIYRRK